MKLKDALLTKKRVNAMEFNVRGSTLNTSTPHRRAGVVSEVAWIYYQISPNCGQGEEDQNPDNFEDVINGRAGPFRNL